MRSEEEIDAAIIAHAEWVRQYREQVDGAGQVAIDPEVAGDHQDCRLGRWLQGTTHPFNAEQLEQLDHIHREFHHQAGAVAFCLKSSNAREKIESPLEKLQLTSRKLIELLKSCKS